MRSVRKIIVTSESMDLRSVVRQEIERVAEQITFKLGNRKYVLSESIQVKTAPLSSIPCYMESDGPYDVCFLRLGDCFTKKEHRFLISFPGFYIIGRRAVFRTEKFGAGTYRKFLDVSNQKEYKEELSKALETYVLPNIIGRRRAESLHVHPLDGRREREKNHDKDIESRVDFRRNARRIFGRRRGLNNGNYVPRH